MYRFFLSLDIIRSISIHLWGLVEFFIPGAMPRAELTCPFGTQDIDNNQPVVHYEKNSLVVFAG